MSGSLDRPVFFSFAMFGAHSGSFVLAQESFCARGELGGEPLHIPWAEACPHYPDSEKSSHTYITLLQDLQVGLGKHL